MMQMTPGRWISACVVGCVLIAVTLLPPTSWSSDSEELWAPASDHAALMMTRRARVRLQHGEALSIAYEHARDMEVAATVFGAHPVTATATPDIWFDADVPAATRQQLTKHIADESAARGAWRGRGPVGVLVFTDTSKRIAGIVVPWNYNAGQKISTQVLPASKATGNRCVAIIRLGHYAFDSKVPPGRDLLDGCAFYDAFGAPGPQIAAWLKDERFAFTRALWLGPPDSAEAMRQRTQDFGTYVDNDERTRCAGGVRASCPAMIHQDTALTNYYADMWYWRDSGIPASPESLARYNRPVFVGNSLMETLVRDLGPGRFQKLWQSQSTLEQGYFDATGESFNEWLYRDMVRWNGKYHIGPLPTLASAFATILAVIATLAASMRWARRPFAA